MVKRMIETNLQEEDVKMEGTLRPQKLNDFFMGRPALGKPPVQELLQMKWGFI